MHDAEQPSLLPKARTFSSPPKEPPTLHEPPGPPPAPHCWSVSEDLPVLDSPYTWNHTIGGFFQHLGLWHQLQKRISGIPPLGRALGLSCSRGNLPQSRGSSENTLRVLCGSPSPVSMEPAPGAGGFQPGQDSSGGVEAPPGAAWPPPCSRGGGAFAFPDSEADFSRRGVRLELPCGPSSQLGRQVVLYPAWAGVIRSRCSSCCLSQT